MRNNAARKIETIHTRSRAKAEIFHFETLTKVQIATQAEIACHLPANCDAPDFEEFLSHYGKGVASDFA